MDNIIEFQNVSFRYDGDTETPLPYIIEHLDFAVRRGEFVAVLGHNGSGKSTLAKLSNAILLPEEGRVLVDGMDTANEDLKDDIRQTVGMVFQNPDNQIVATIVEEDVAFGPENLGVAPQEIRRRVDEALKAVEMYDFREKEPHRLSGGQKQRVAIARALMRKPSLLLADEPVASLDPVTGRQILALLQDIQRTEGVAILMNSHNLDQSRAVSTRLLGLHAGRIVLDGAPAAVTDADLARIYGGAESGAAP